jgi:hypothetical protein
MPTTLPAQDPTKYSDPYGGKPAVPDPESILRNTIGANLGMMPDIKGLGRKVSNYFWNQTTGRVPGYEDMAGQSAQNIGAQLRGEVPEDVLYQIGQGAAERGISRGGGFSNADYLRSLGLTSLGLMGEGEKGLTGALQRAESIPMFDISKYMLSPQDAYNAQFQSNVIGAAPDPAAAAQALKNELANASKTTPGQFTGMTGGGSGGGTPRPSASSTWSNAWAPTGDVGTTGYRPATSTYNPWGPTGWTGPMGAYGSSSQGPSGSPGWNEEDDYWWLGGSGSAAEAPTDNEMLGGWNYTDTGEDLSMWPESADYWYAGE